MNAPRDIWEKWLNTTFYFLRRGAICERCDVVRGISMPASHVLRVMDDQEHPTVAVCDRCRLDLRTRR